MASTTTTSSYARLSPWQARAVLIALVLLVGLGLWKSPTPPPLCDVREENARSGDVFLYMTEIKRIHAGENYYQVAAEELVAQGYPTASVFNWRTPLPMWLIGKLPDPLLGRLILIAAGIAMLLMAFEAAAREQPNVYRLAMPLAALLIGPMLPCFQGDVFVLTEVWAGIMIALSLCAYGVELRFLGAIDGPGRALPSRVGPALLRAGPGPGPLATAAEGVDGVYRRPDWLGGLLRTALLEGQPLDHSHGRGPSPRLGAVRRPDVRHRRDPDELVPRALAGVGNRDFLRPRDARLRRLADGLGDADHPRRPACMWWPFPSSARNSIATGA